MERLDALQPSLHRGPGSLLAVLRTYWSAHQAIGTLRAYTHDHSNADTRHDGWQQRKSRVDHLYVASEAAGACLEPELLAAGDDVRGWLRDEPELAPFRVPVERTPRRGLHTLDADQEKLLAQTSEPHRAAFETFVPFTSAELAFDHIDVDGTSTQLTPATLRRLRLHPDRATRRQAFDGFYGTFGRHQALLRAGGSDDAHQLLVSAGVDLTQPEPYRALVRQMESLLDEMEHLFDEQILPLT